MRERVLCAAVELLEQEGLAALSLREVARRAGVSHQAPYHYFASREDILAAIAQEGFVVLEREVAAARAGAPDARTAFARAGRAYVDFALAHPAHFRLMFRPELVDVAGRPEVMACGAKAFGHVPLALRAVLAEGPGEGRENDALVAVTWGAVHGLACLLLDGPIQLMLPRFASDPRAALSDALEALTRLIEPAKPKGRRTARAGRAGRLRGGIREAASFEALGSGEAPAPQSPGPRDRLDSVRYLP